jgi:hypothetical protein
MFDKGISDEFVNALMNWQRWKEIISDEDLYVAIRKEYINIYYQGCSIFKVSYKGGRLIFETHYKYLIRPIVLNPYVLWKGDRPDVKDRWNDILIDEFNLDSLKKSSCWYSEDEKVGVHRILKSNKNVVDVEVALSPKSDVETDIEDQNPKGRRGADRIDFAAIQRKDGKPCIVFFEVKRFDNGELRSQKFEPAVLKQIKKYEVFIEKYRPQFETSYRRVCKNLVDLALNPVDPLVKEVAERPEQLTIDSGVRLVVFGYDRDQENGKVWNKHKEILRNYLKDRLLLKGSPSEFTHGIGKYSLKVAP